MLLHGRKILAVFADPLSSLQTIQLRRCQPFKFFQIAVRLEGNITIQLSSTIGLVVHGRNVPKPRREWLPETFSCGFIPGVEV